MIRIAKLFSLIGVLAILSGCNLFGVSTIKYKIDEAPIESIEILILESFPVQVQAVVHGVLSDGCTSLYRTQVETMGNRFEVKIETIRPRDEVCIQVISEFEEVVDLDVYGLLAGTYTVSANGVTDSFELAVDNKPM